MKDTIINSAIPELKKARSLHKRGNLLSAEKVFYGAIQTTTSNHSLSTEESLLALNDLATVLIESHKLSNAQILLDKIDSFLALEDTKSPFLRISLLLNQIKIANYLGDTDASQEMLKVILPLSHDEDGLRLIPEILEAIAICNLDFNCWNPKIAHEALLKSQEILKQTQRTDTLTYCSVLKHLGILEYRSGNTALALSIWKKALTITKKIANRGHPLTVHILTLMADASLLVNAVNKAEILAEKAKNFEQNGNKNPFMLALIYFSLSKIKVKKRRVGPGKLSLKKALSYLEKTPYWDKDSQILWIGEFLNILKANHLDDAEFQELYAKLIYSRETLAITDPN